MKKEEIIQEKKQELKVCMQFKKEDKKAILEHLEKIVDYVVTNNENKMFFVSLLVEGDTLSTVQGIQTIQKKE